MQNTTRILSIAAVALFAALNAGCAGMEEEMHPEVAFAPAAASCDATQAAGRVCGCVYDVPLSTRRLPDFAMFRPVEMMCTDRLAVSLRNGPPGFPGVMGRYEWFGVDFHGSFVVAEPGAFSFRLSSDDGAKVFIDDALVLNNDGYHDVRTVETVIPLAAGEHRIRVPYYDGPGPMALTLEVGRPGGDYEIMRFDQPL